MEACQIRARRGKLRGVKLNSTAVILIIACALLALVLVVSDKKHAEETQKEEQTIQELTNNLSTVQDKLSQQVIVNSALETNLAATKLEDSNALAAVKTELANTAASLEKTRADAKAAAAAAETALAERDKKIGDLEGKNTEMDKEAEELRGSITNLQTQIDITKKKLATSEGDRATLLVQLKALQAQKDDLEQKYNDLASLKAQVKKLKDNLAISRRLDWIRDGLYDSIRVKGGERQMHPLATAPPPGETPMNVEIRQDGTVRVTAPTPTNTPPQ
jgi:chromosome segregation ATPase